jgi:asparagine synthase (glutamine-hydrolysing)
VGFDIPGEGEKFNADFNLARKTAEFFNSDHHELLISGKDILNNIERAAYHMDEPISNHTQVVTMLLSEYATKEVTVVLGGDGGDEIFGGYDRYRRSKIISDFQKLPAFAQKILSPLSEKLNMRGAQRYLSFMSQKESDLKAAIKPGFLDYGKVEKFFSEKYFSNGSGDYENDFMFTDFRTWLADESLMRTDKMSMAHGLEERVPFLDRELVELGYSIPSKYKVCYFKSKIILKEAMRPFLPKYLFNQPKRGWFSPMAKWLRTDLKDFAYEVLSPDYCPATQEFFDFAAIRKILDDHIEKRKYNLNLIWSLITFQLWYKRFIV